MARVLKISCFLSLVLTVYAYEEHDFSNAATYDISALYQKILTGIYAVNNENLSDLRFNHVSENFFQQASERLNSTQNLTQCSKDIIYIAENYNESWVLQMLDSFGKPESSILQGNTKWLGDYSECLKVYAPAPATNFSGGNFRGQYCTLMQNLMLPGLVLPITLGVCIPDSCTAAEFPESILELLSVATNTSLKTNQTIPLDCKPRERKLNGPSIAVIVLSSLFLTLAVLGSAQTIVKYILKIVKDDEKPSLAVNILPTDLGNDVDYQKNNFASDGENSIQTTPPRTYRGFMGKVEPFLECFCMFKNGAKLLNTDAREGELLCIHGIRFLSMSWVILGHAYAFCFQYIKNLLQVFDNTNKWPFQIISQAFYSVDSFFVLSGFLLTYLLMQEFAKNKGPGSVNWIYFYVHRYIRLTPVYLILLGFYSTVFFYLGSGPLWPTYDVEPLCKETWWWNVLYINNFTDKQCFGHSWYLANDMQFFVISPLILMALWWWRPGGFLIIETLMVVCWLSNFLITYYYDLVPGVSYFLNGVPTEIDYQSIMLNINSYFMKIYIKPYTRIAPYLIGMATGYVLFLNKKNKSPKLSLGILSLGWTIATTITLACVYGLYDQSPGLVGRSFYNALTRTTWAIGLCWVIYVCLINQGGFVNTILSYKLFIPLSRLTYTAYLIHPMIITGYYGSLRNTFQFSHLSVVILYLGMMVVTYALALPVALVFESPVISLEKYIRKKFSKRD